MWYYNYTKEMTGMKKYKTYELEGKLYDAYFHRGVFDGLIEVDVYEVKNPNRKRFGRHFFWWGESYCLWIDDFSTLNNLLYYAVAKAVEQRNLEESRQRKYEEFLETIDN